MLVGVLLASTAVRLGIRRAGVGTGGCVVESLNSLEIESKDRYMYILKIYSSKNLWFGNGVYFRSTPFVSQALVGVDY